MDIKRIICFFIICIIFQAGNCLPNDYRFYGDGYTQSNKLNLNVEEANKTQLRQIDVENKIRTKIIDLKYEKQQFEIDDKIKQKEAINENKYHTGFLTEGTLRGTKKAKTKKNENQIENKINFEVKSYHWDGKQFIEKDKSLETK